MKFKPNFLLSVSSVIAFCFCGFIGTETFANSDGDVLELQLEGSGGLVPSYGAVTCVKALHQEMTVEEQLVNRALNSPNPKAQMFQLLMDYGVVSSPYFLDGLRTFLFQYGLNDHQVQMVLAQEPIIKSQLGITPPLKKDKLKAWLDVFQVMVSMAGAGEVSNLVQMSATPFRVVEDSENSQSTLFVKRFARFVSDLRRNFNPETAGSWIELGFGKNRNPSQRNLDISVRHAQDNLLYAMNRLGGDALFLGALAPFFEHLFVKSAEIVALQIRDSLESNTEIFYNRIFTYLGATGGASLTYWLGLDPMTIFGLRSQGLARVLLIGIPSAAIAHLSAYLHIPWTSNRAKEKVEKILKRPLLKTELGFGPYTVSVNRLFENINLREIPQGLSLDSLCPDQDLCRLTPPQIAVIGDVEIDYLSERVEALAENEKLKDQLNRDILRVLELGKSLEAEIVAQGPQASEKHLRQINQILAVLSSLSGNWTRAQYHNDPMMSRVSPKVQLEFLRSEVQEKKMRVAKVLAYLQDLTPKSGREVEQMIFLISKMRQHEAELTRMENRLVEIENQNGWIDWLEAAIRESDGLHESIMKDVRRMYMDSTNRSLAMQILWVGLRNFDRNVPLRRPVKTP